MSKILLITTWPEHGSRNIGDWLISHANESAFRRKLTDLEVRWIWREASPQEYRQGILWADVVAFSYLAIRGNMRKYYPQIDLILDSGLPLVAIGSGASPNPLKALDDLSSFTSDTIRILTEIDRRALAFTARGRLTQGLLGELGIKNSHYSGDVAFNQPKVRRRFVEKSRIQHVGISSPHRPRNYQSALSRLIRESQRRFPDARHTLLLHGDDKDLAILENFADVESLHLYRSPPDGFDVYDSLDLHLGFRVHGHVSSLVRGIPSFLLEQDGRGTDYGTAFELQTTKAAFLVSPIPSAALRQFAQRAITLKGLDRNTLDFPIDGLSPLLSLLDFHRDRGFTGFESLNSEIDEIEDLTESAFASVVAKLS